MASSNGSLETERQKPKSPAMEGPCKLRKHDVAHVSSTLIFFLFVKSNSDCDRSKFYNGCMCVWK